jgi:glycosyltransferase involved in cell wall biosynthesis
MVRAVSQLRDQGHDIVLVIAGGRGWLEDEMYLTIHELDAQRFVKLIGFADERDISALYSGAVCSAFISLYEGFGFPVLESMACGTPVVTSNISSIPEVAGDAALMVNPLSLDDVTGALKRLTTEPALRKKLAERGFAQARRFNWHRSAKHLKQIYDHILAEG